ncbi:MAG: hypothetical protein KGI52_07080 [Burkholderiales bacterium]|nr:hypothetical protein [Burkholderiales bacterium]
MNFTLPQFRAYQRAAAQAERDRLAALLVVVATGAQGSADGIQQLGRTLQRKG